MKLIIKIGKQTIGFIYFNGVSIDLKTDLLTFTLDGKKVAVIRNGLNFEVKE